MSQLKPKTATLGYSNPLACVGLSIKMPCGVSPSKEICSRRGELAINSLTDSPSLVGTINTICFSLSCSIVCLSFGEISTIHNFLLREMGQLGLRVFSKAGGTE